MFLDADEQEEQEASAQQNSSSIGAEGVSEDDTERSSSAVDAIPATTPEVEQEA